MIFGLRAVIEALEAGKEIDRMLIRQIGRASCRERV